MNKERKAEANKVKDNQDESDGTTAAGGAEAYK